MISPESSFPFYKPDDDNLIYHSNVNKKEGFLAIKSCTLTKIIEKLTSTVNFDIYFTSAFFLTYRDFTTPLEVVNLLAQRYVGPPQGSSKDNLRLFEIEVDVVQENVIIIVRQLISTLTADDFNNTVLNESIQFFFNSLPEEIKNELFMIYYKTRKSVRPMTDSNLTTNTNGSNGGNKNQITGSAASTMRFSFSVSPKTQSPSSTNGVLTGLLQSTNGGSGSNSPTLEHSTSNNNSPYGNSSKSMKLGKGLMSKILQSGGNINSISELSATGSVVNSGIKEGLNNSNGISSNSGGTSNDSLDAINNNNGDIRPSFLPESIARELTIMEWELITALSLSEFTLKTYKDRQAAVNIANLTTWFNRISSWVTTKIISKETPEERATIIEAFITIANYAKDLKNFNCVMEILGSLHSSSISRLKNSWALVSVKLNETFTALNQLMSSDHNFKNYRKQLTLIAPNEPCIPYLGLFLTDFLYLDESNPPFSPTNPGMVNIERIYLIGTRVQEFFKLFTNCQYSFTSNPNVREAILSEKVWDENETFRLSRIREEQMNTNSPISFHHQLKESMKDSSKDSGKDSGKDINGGKENTVKDNKDSNGNKDNGGHITASSSQSFPVTSSSTNSPATLSTSAANTRRKNFVQKYRMSFTGNDPPPPIASSLSERDWKVLTTNSKILKFKKDQKILNFGDFNHNLYRITIGRVKVEPFCINKFNNTINNNNSDQSIITTTTITSTPTSTTPPTTNTTNVESPLIGKKVETAASTICSSTAIEYQYLEQGDIFGEEAFLYEKPNLITVTSDSDDLEIIQIEKNFILQLFATEPILSATFYKYIAVLMAERLKTIYSNFHPSGSIQTSSLPLISSTSLSSSTTNNPLKGSASSPTLSKLNYDYSKRRSTIYETPTSLDAIRDGNDYKFRNTFGLSNQEEVIIKSYTCKHNNINGTLYITKHHLCFEGKFLTIHKQKLSPFSSISKILPEKNTLSIYTKEKIKKFTFKVQEDLSEAYGLMARIWKNHHTDTVSVTSNPLSKSTSMNNPTGVSVSTTPPLIPKSPKVGRGESFSNITDLPTKEEWNMILKGAKSLTFKKGDILMCEGIEYQKIFQIIKGECSIVKSILSATTGSSGNGSKNNSPNSSPIGGAEIPSPQALVDPKNSITISKLSEGSIYGEMTFLLSGGCSTSLVVSSDEVEVFILESYFLNIIMKSKPQLAPKFYKYLACVLESRVKQYRQQTLLI